MTQRHTELLTLRNRLSRVDQRLTYTVEQIAKNQARLDALEAEKAKLAKVVILIDKAIAVISANGVGRIETTVTNGLRLIFNDPTLAFRVIKKDGKSGSSYQIEGQHGDVSGPFLDTFGGGLANVASFLLRIIIIKRFKMGKFILLDEQFNNVSTDNLPMVSEVVRTLAKEGGFTIFAVTHQPVLAASADRIYKAVPHGKEPPTLELISAGELAAEVAASDFFDEEARDRTFPSPEPPPPFIPQWVLDQTKDLPATESE